MYDVIICDPPWSYNNKKMGGTHKSGAAQKYKTMNLEEIKSIPIQLISNKNSILFLWATVPLLPEGLEVMKAFNHKYKTSIFWHKLNINGTGYYYRGIVEILLVGIKGKVKAFYYQEPNIISHKVLGHSIKPDIFRELIEQSVSIKNPKIIELFATKQYKNWTCLGSSLTGNDIITDINKLTRQFN